MLKKSNWSPTEATRPTRDRISGGDTPVEEVIGILLLETNLSIRFPVESLMRYVDSMGLEADDSLEDLFAATQESGGIRFLGGND